MSHIYIYKCLHVNIRKLLSQPRSHRPTKKSKGVLTGRLKGFYWTLHCTVKVCQKNNGNFQFYLLAVNCEVCMLCTYRVSTIIIIVNRQRGRLKLLECCSRARGDFRGKTYNIKTSISYKKKTHNNYIPKHAIFCWSYKVIISGFLLQYYCVYILIFK